MVVSSTGHTIPKSAATSLGEIFEQTKGEEDINYSERLYTAKTKTKKEETCLLYHLSLLFIVVVLNVQRST